MSDLTLRGQVMAMYNTRDFGRDDGNNDPAQETSNEKYSEVWEAIRDFLGQHAAHHAFDPIPPVPAAFV
jgi:hypothetical protein